MCTALRVHHLLFIVGCADGRHTATATGAKPSHPKHITAPAAAQQRVSAARHSGSSNALLLLPAQTLEVPGAGQNSHAVTAAAAAVVAIAATAG